MPDDLLGPLGDGPLPPLAPAAAVRARGDQRRRRGAAVLAGATALSLVLGAAAASALLSGDERDALQARPAPSVSTSPSPASEPSPQGSPTAGPTATPGSPAEPSPTRTQRAYEVSDLVLTTADADRAEPGDWAPNGNADEGPLLDPCPGGTAYPRDADRTGDASTVLESRREAGGTGLLQQVARYSSEAAAQDAFTGYGRAVRGCPTKTDEGTTARHEVLDESRSGGVRTLLVRFSSTCPEQCVGSYEYYAVQQRGDAVSVLVVGYGEDGDPGVDVLTPFADLEAEKLRDVVR